MKSKLDLFLDKIVFLFMIKIMKKSSQTGWIAWLLYSIGAYILLIPFFAFSLKTLCGAIILGFFGMMLNAIIQLLTEVNSNKKI